MLPTEITTHFKEGRIRTEMSFGFGTMKTIGISDSQNKEATILMELFSKKYVVRNALEKISDEPGAIKPYTLNPSKESKKIAGMNCSKIDVIDENKKIGISRLSCRGDHCKRYLLEHSLPWS